MPQKKINVNTAGEAELRKIKGVGPSLAKRIVDYREEHGPFQGAEDLKNILGEGGTFNRLQGQFLFEKGVSGGMQTAEKEFLKEAAKGNVMEMRLVALSMEKSASEKVKEFSKRLKEEHSMLKDQLEAIAREKNVRLPGDLDKKHKRPIDRISGLSGEEFDRAYMEIMIEEHERDIEKYATKADEATDPDLQEFASETVPKLKSHLEHAREVQRELA